jgi:HAD superfamily hydrolase (TIGR01509 family)
MENEKDMLEAVIFDRDGILINSEEIHIQSSLKALEKLGIKPDLFDKKLIIGRHPNDYGLDFLKKYAKFGFSYDIFRKYQKEFYYDTIDNAPIFEEAIKLIKILHASKIPLGLATSSSKENTARFLDRTVLKKYFNAVTTFEDCTKRKPEPEPYIVTANKLQMNPKYCVAIEDTAIGVESAKRAGMKCIAIPNEYTANQDFSRADAVVNSAKEITLEFLQKIIK